MSDQPHPLNDPKRPVRTLGKVRTLADLRKLAQGGCGNADCKDPACGNNGFFLHSVCHPNKTVVQCYFNAEEGVLELSCVCDRPIAKIAIKP